MQNLIVINKKTYNAQLMWRTKDNKYDDDDNLFPNAKEGVPWNDSKTFTKLLSNVQILIENNISTNLHNNTYKYAKCKHCLLCDKKCVTRKMYMLGEYIWDDGMIHYIKNHNAKPHNNFIDFIFGINFEKDFSININGKIVCTRSISMNKNEYNDNDSDNDNNNNKNKNKNIDKICHRNKNKIVDDIDNTQYLKLEKNQIMILDALMKHGGYTKKYYDSEKTNLVRYSEHAGFLEIKDKHVYEIIVSGNTLRIDKGDEEIFLPSNMENSKSFKYIFHTHPPTPKPGGRVIDGIIYEFPSVGDILHFIDSFNEGKTIGSIVMTSEGIYNIRKLHLDSKKINIDENKMYDDIRKEIWNTNKKAIEKYGVNFSTETFYSVISQDTTYINKINKQLNKYMLHIDFYSRTKDFKGSWIVDTMHIPLYEKYII